MLGATRVKLKVRDKRKKMTATISGLAKQQKQRMQYDQYKKVYIIGFKGLFYRDGIG